MALFVADHVVKFATCVVAEYAKLAQDAAFGSKYAKAGENAAAFEQRIRQELNSPATQSKWAGDLARVGFG
ncbi:hypothetical protein [Psychrobacter sp. I-STPA10]|uniref:hypothetical protein n=1 Tax=Psychrobacter sp. I-STPA10 TaxID=2585769 RepID=UPI001E3581E1|nr:hypothetical protein [Psychrobacter sp. I-STPA10]